MAAGIGYAVGMENRTQPILCCVGADVAGQPTQFLMERTASAAHLDWHVITVEVTSDQLAKAWGGMDVMQFQAVRFFPTHQAGAMRLVAEPSADDLFIGGVSSAMRTGDKWTMWHNSGPALVDLVAARVNWSSAICWVHGNTAQVRSFLVACRTKPPRRIFWTGANLGQAQETSITADVLVDSIIESIAMLPIVVIPPASESEIANLLKTPIGEDGSIAAVVHVGEMESSHLELLLANQPDFECALTIVSAAPGSRRKLSDAWRAGEVVVLTPADVVIAEEAYDQARWTGQPVNIELLREAYEEYVDF